MKKKILTVLCVLTGLMFINAGLNKFFNYLPMPEDIPEEVMNMFAAMMQIKWLLPLVAIFEILGGILLVVPKWRALGAIVLFPLMVGIMASHITIKDYSPIPFILSFILVWVIFENRMKYMPMIKG